MLVLSLLLNMPYRSLPQKTPEMERNFMALILVLKVTGSRSPYQEKPCQPMGLALLPRAQSLPLGGGAAPSGWGLWGRVLRPKAA